MLAPSLVAGMWKRHHRGFRSSVSVGKLRGGREEGAAAGSLEIAAGAELLPAVEMPAAPRFPTSRPCRAELQNVFFSFFVFSVSLFCLTTHAWDTRTERFVAKL